MQIKLGSYILFLIIGSALLASCERDNFSADPKLKLAFSTDTMHFDTVFTTIGSATRHFKVYNRHRSDLLISSVKLAGGASSFFRMNVDGEATNHARNVVIRGGDSLFVFVEVTVDPTNQSSPLLIADSIVFETNGNVQDVKLIAWGQDVYLHNASEVSGNLTLPNDKPHLIYSYLYVEPGSRLIVQPGTRFYMHNNAFLAVAGTLNIEGTFDNPVSFEGDRLEPFYRDKAGQWAGIWLMAGSRNNSIDWARIKNGIYGIIADTVMTPGVPTLRITNSRVENMSYTCLLGRGATIEAANSLFSNAANIAVALTIGGRYRFYHCTIANYWAYYIQRKGPALLLNNFYTYKHPVTGAEMVEPRDMEEALFSNCIIYGSRDNEFKVDNLYNGAPVNALMSYRFEHCILRVPQTFNLSNTSLFINVSRENPKFKDTRTYNFQLDTLSPAKDVGLLSTALLFPFDLNNVSRLNDTGPDLGAFERVERP